MSPRLDEQFAGRYARRRVPGRRGQNLGPDGVAGNRLLVLERHAAVGLLDRFPAADGGRPAAQGHLALAHARVQREGRAVADRGDATSCVHPCRVSAAPEPPRRDRSPRADPSWHCGKPAAAASGSRRPWARGRRLARWCFARGPSRGRRRRRGSHQRAREHGLW